MPPLLLLCLACSGAIDKAEERMKEEATEAIMERVLGADNVEVDTTTGKVSVLVDGKTIEVDKTGAMFVDGDTRVAAGDRADIPDTPLFNMPANATLNSVVTGEVDGFKMVDVNYTVTGSTLDAEEARLSAALAPLGLTVTPVTIDARRAASAKSEDGRHRVQYGILEQPEGIRVQVTESNKPEEAPR